MDTQEMTTLYVRKEIDLEKVVAFVSANAHRVKFLVPPEFVDALVRRLEEFAAANPGRIVLEIREPDGERVVLFAAAGAGVGAVVGGALGGWPGALVGGAVGACVGAGAAHLTLRLESAENGRAAALMLA